MEIFAKTTKKIIFLIPKGRKMKQQQLPSAVLRGKASVNMFLVQAKSPKYQVDLQRTAFISPKLLLEASEIKPMMTSPRWGRGAAGNNHFLLYGAGRVFRENKCAAEGSPGEP